MTSRILHPLLSLLSSPDSIYCGICVTSLMATLGKQRDHVGIYDRHFRAPGGYDRVT